MIKSRFHIVVFKKKIYDTLKNNCLSYSLNYNLTDEGCYQEYKINICTRVRQLKFEQVIMNVLDT
jgi:hypothetical protein